MIAVNMRNYDYFTFGDKDEYGQAVLSEDVQGSIKMCINLLSQNKADNVKYAEATYIALTLDDKVNNAYVIQYGDQKLKVLYVNPFGRFKQVYLSEY